MSYARGFVPRRARVQLREPGRELFRAEALDHVIGRTEVDETDGHVAVLGFVVLACESGAQRRRHEQLDLSRCQRGQEGSTAVGSTAARARTRIPSPLTRPSTVVGSCDAVSGLTRISPAVAAASISSVRVTSGPITKSSRCSAPVVITRKTPLCTPCDMRNVTAPRSVTTGPRARKRGAHRDGGADRRVARGRVRRKGGRARRRRTSGGRRPPRARRRGAR